MLDTLFDTIFRDGHHASEFQSISRSQLRARELARKTVVNVKRKSTHLFRVIQLV